MGTRPYPIRRLTGLCAALAAAAVGLSAVPAHAGPASRQAQADAIVLRQLSFFRVQDLDFGDIIPGTAGGTVRILPNGTRTATGTVVLSGTTHEVARFAGMGTFNQQVDISISSSTVQLTGPGTPMTVSLFEIGSTPTAILTPTPTRFRIAAANGQFNFPVGATLTIGANQAAGSYAGTFAITLNYL